MWGPEVVYRNTTYQYRFHHDGRRWDRDGSTLFFDCKKVGDSRDAWVGLISDTGTVSPYNTGSADDAAWLQQGVANVNPGNQHHPAERTTNGVPSTSYRTNRFHRTGTHNMPVYIPNQAPRGSTFKIAFFQGSNGNVELSNNGHIGTVYVAPVPDAPPKPTIAWGPTRNQVRIEFPANTHDGSDRIYSYGVEIRRLKPDDTFTNWGWAASVNQGTGTLSALVQNLQPSTHYQVRVFARARLSELGDAIYYGPASDELGFTTRSVLDPDPPTGFRAHQVYYNRAEVRWWAPSHVGHSPLTRYTIHARRWTGSAWTAWGHSANVAPDAGSHLVTQYCSGGGSHSYCPSANLVDFEPGTYYQLRIAARNNIGNTNSTARDSAWTELLEIQTISPVPVAPNKPTISELRHDSVRVHWEPLTNDGAERIYSWGVQRREPDGSGGLTDWEWAANANANQTSVVVRNLTPSTIGNNAVTQHYQVRVFARARTCDSDTCPTFWSPASDERGFNMRTREPTAPDAPTLSNPQSTPEEGTTIDVSWMPPEWLGETDSINHYDVYVQVDGSWHESLPRTPPRGNDTSPLTLTGYTVKSGDTNTAHVLAPGTEYRVRVRAVSRVVHQNGNVEHLLGAWSGPSSFAETLPGAPGRPLRPRYLASAQPQPARS